MICRPLSCLPTRVQGMLKSLAAGTTPYKQSQMQEELGEIKDDVRTLGRWRHALVSCSAFVGATTAAAVGLATAAYIGFILEAATRS